MVGMCKFVDQCFRVFYMMVPCKLGFKIIEHKVRKREKMLILKQFPFLIFNYIPSIHIFQSGFWD